MNIITLNGEIDDDLAERIHRSVMLTLNHFKIVYNAKSILISWTERLSRPQYSNLVEDVTSLFNSINIIVPKGPSMIDEPVIGKELDEEWVDILEEYYGYVKGDHRHFKQPR